LAPGWVSAGIYLFDRVSLDAIAALGRGLLERDLLEREPAGAFRAFRVEGGFIDMGTPETFAAARLGLGAIGPRPEAS
jgi:NDP-sugar pyrophosphorylase family protein